ncbi:hypothetical protein JCM3765_005549 [Sporobolomyces pararoseus]
MSHLHLPSIDETLHHGFQSEDEESEEEPASPASERQRDALAAKCYLAEINYFLDAIVRLSSGQEGETREHSIVSKWRDDIHSLLETPKNPGFNYYTSGKKIQETLTKLKETLERKGINELFDGADIKKEHRAKKIVKSFELKDVTTERVELLAEALKRIGKNAGFAGNDLTFVNTWRNPIFHSIIKRFSVVKDETWYTTLAILHQTAAEAKRTRKPISDFYERFEAKSLLRKIEVQFLAQRTLLIHPPAGRRKAGGSSSTQNSLTTSRYRLRLSRRKLTAVYQDLR